ncbi:ZN208 protein, partial [Donacobius atricapilla]|nr:ZN208 protein [Donacobius atricapilla]
RPSLCQEGGQRSSWNSELAEKSHGVEKPHRFLECGKDFSYKSILKKHHRIHTGEKPSERGECRKIFRDSSGLNWHQVIH